MQNLDKNIEEMFEEFKRSLDKYMHLLYGGKIDRQRALTIEKTELMLSELFFREGLCTPDDSLNENLRRLIENDLKISLIKSALDNLRNIDDSIKLDFDFEKALERFLSGELETPEAKVVAIIVQSLARCIAHHRLVRGVEDRLSPYCPVCGAESRTMVVRQDGYHMVCPFCGYEWRISRSMPRCPWCGNDNPISIGVFTNKQRRIGLMVCQECGNTWRAILDRSIKAPNILLPLISLGAERFRTFVRRDMTSRTGD